MTDLTLKQHKRLAAAVARGANLLDERIPGWFRQLKLRTLNMAVLNDFIWQNAPKLAPARMPVGSTLTYGMTWKRGVRNGFDLPLWLDWSPTREDALVAMWKDEIRARR